MFSLSKSYTTKFLCDLKSALKEARSNSFVQRNYHIIPLSVKVILGKYNFNHSQLCWLCQKVIDIIEPETADFELICKIIVKLYKHCRHRK